LNGEGEEKDSNDACENIDELIFFLKKKSIIKEESK
jgi:hypothetical protein